MLIDITAYIRNTVYERISVIDFAFEERADLIPIVRSKKDLSDVRF